MRKKQTLLARIGSFTETVEIVSKNAYVSEPFTLWQPNLYFRTIVDASNCEHLVLVLDEYTEIEDLKSIWKQVQAKVLSLDVYQGSKIDSEKDRRIYSLLLWRELDKMSWKQLRLTLNYIAVASAYSAYIERNKRKEKLAGAVIDPYLQEMRKGLKKEYFYGAGRALAITFMVLRKGKKDFGNWMGNAFDFFEREEWESDVVDSPFDPNDGDKIRNRVDTFTGNIKHGKIRGGKRNLNVNIYEEMIYILHHTNCFSKVNELLDKTGGLGWKKNGRLLQRRVSKIIDNWDKSQVPKIIQARNKIKKARKT